MSSYSILAKYYDRLMGDFDYDAYVGFVKDKLSGEGVDLACGSGEITVRLAKAGCRMTGIDLSSEMLNVAREKARRAGLDVKWVCQDMQELELNHKVDFVTAVCDGFNYIPPDKLGALLKKIRGNLKSGGVLIFDVSSEYKLKNVLGNNLFCEDYDDVTYIWQNKLRRNCVDMDVDFFERTENGLYRRVEETHRQYIHTKDFLESLLKDGWKREIYDGEKFCKVSPKSKRLLFICRTE